MTYDKIFKYGTCKESQYGYRLAQKIRFFCRDGNYAVIPVRNLEAAGVSLRKGGRVCRQSNSGTRPEDCLHGQALRKSYTGNTPIRRIKGQTMSEVVYGGLGSLTLQRSEEWLSQEGTERAIELEYSFDRLSSRKIGQAYHLLVPDKNWCTNSERNHVKGESGGKREGCSDLCASIIGPTKGRTDYCQPDCGVDRIFPAGRLHGSR